MSDRGPSATFTGVLAGLALLLCCGAPLLLGALGAAGLGAGLLWQGAIAAGLVVLAASGAFAVRWLRRRRTEPCAECAGSGGDTHPDHSLSA